MSTRPRFIGIGTERAGTSWLYAVLRNTPGAWVPPIKELHYWDWVDPDSSARSLRWTRHGRFRLRSNLAALPGLRTRAHNPARLAPGFDLRYFTGRRSAAWYQRLFDAGPDGAVTGEITPSYWRLSERGISQLCDGVPGVRLVMSLRDPVTCMWSRGVKVVARDRGLRADQVSEDQWLRWAERAGTLDYAGAIRRWRAVFSDGQLHLAWFDELTEAPATYLGGIFDHLGLEADPGAMAERFNRRVNPAAAGQREPPDRVREVLIERMAPSVESLRAEVDDSSWVDRWLTTRDAAS